METDQAKRKAELFEILQRAQRIPQNLLTDQEMLARCQSKEPQTSRMGLNQLIQRYQNQVYAYLTHMLGDEQAACEAARDVFAQAYQAIGRVPPDLSVKAWLLMLAKKRVLQAARKRDRWHRRLVPLALYQWQQRIAAVPEPLADVSASAQPECADIRGRLAAYHDGELSAEEAARVEAHSNACEPCRLEAEQLLETVDVVQTFGLSTAPANLQREINAALDYVPLWEYLFTSVKEWGGNFSFPLSQAAVVAATMIMLIGLNYYQYHNMQALNALNARLRTANANLKSAVRGETQAGQDMMQNTFVIFTGKTISEGMPLEAGEYVASLFPEAANASNPLFILSPEPAKAPNQLFIPGNLTEVSAQIKTSLASLQGQWSEDSIPHQTLAIRKITVELPQNTTALLARLLQAAAPKSPAQPETANIPTVSIELYLIDKP